MELMDPLPRVYIGGIDVTAFSFEGERRGYVGCACPWPPDGRTTYRCPQCAVRSISTGTAHSTAPAAPCTRTPSP